MHVHVQSCTGQNCVPSESLSGSAAFVVVRRAERVRGGPGPARLVARVRGSERGMGIRERNVMVSQSVSFVAVPPAHSTSRNYTSERGGGVSARAHACVALSRCVAFGRPKMSVGGQAGAGSAPAKVACNPASAHLF